MTARELCTVLETLPPETAVCIDAAFANVGKPMLIRTVQLQVGMVVIADHFLLRNQVQFMFTSYDGQEYVISYDA